MDAPTLKGAIVIDLSRWSAPVATVKTEVKEVATAMKAELATASKTATDALNTTASAAKQTGDAFKSSAQGAKASVAGMKEEGREAATLKDKLKELNSEFGKRSTLGMAAKVALGGGAIGAVGLITGQLDDMAKTAAAAFTALRTGSKSAGQVADELAKSIPILGHIYSMGQSINEIFTGTQSDLAQAQARAGAEVENTNKRLSFQKGILADIKASAAAFANAIKEADFRELSAGLQGPGKQRVAAQHAQEGREAEINAQRDKMVADLQAKLDARMKEIDDLAKGGKLSNVEVQASQREAIKGSKDAQDQAKANAESSIRHSRAASAAEQEQIEKQVAERTQKIVADNEESIRQIKAEQAEKTLRANGKILEAEIAQIDEAARRKKDAAQREADEQMKDSGADAQLAIKKSLTAKLGAIDEDAIAERGRVAKEDDERQKQAADRKAEEQKRADDERTKEEKAEAEKRAQTALRVDDNRVATQIANLRREGKEHEAQQLELKHHYKERIDAAIDEEERLSLKSRYEAERRELLDKQDSEDAHSHGGSRRGDGRRQRRVEAPEAPEFDATSFSRMSDRDQRRELTQNSKQWENVRQKLAHENNFRGLDDAKRQQGDMLRKMREHMTDQVVAAKSGKAGPGATVNIAAPQIIIDEKKLAANIVELATPAINEAIRRAGVAARMAAHTSAVKSGV